MNNITKYQDEPSLAAARAMAIGREKRWYFKPMIPDYWNWDVKPADLITILPFPGLESKGLKRWRRQEFL